MSRSQYFLDPKQFAEEDNCNNLTLSDFDVSIGDCLRNSRIEARHDSIEVISVNNNYIRNRRIEESPCPHSHEYMNKSYGYCLNNSRIEARHDSIEVSSILYNRIEVPRHYEDSFGIRAAFDQPSCPPLQHKNSKGNGDSFGNINLSPIRGGGEECNQHFPDDDSFEAFPPAMTNQSLFENKRPDESLLLCQPAADARTTTQSFSMLCMPCNHEDHSMSKVEYHSDRNMAYINYALNSFSIIKQKKTPRERRPLMSILTQVLTKDEARAILGMEISISEWKNARKHAISPGVGEPNPPNPIYFRKRMKEAVVAEFIEWLHASGCLQNLSFGHKVVTYCNGVHTAIEAVKLTKSIRKIIREYATIWNLNSTNNIAVDEEGVNVGGDESAFIVEDEENRCCATCKKSNRRCFLPKNHEKKRHCFTPKGQISPSSIEKLLGELTAGRIKSMAGLDDTDVEKGSQNFHQMKAIVQNLTAVGTIGRASNSEAEELKRRIDRVEEFHKVGFPRHLGSSKYYQTKLFCTRYFINTTCTNQDIFISKTEESRHICTCFKCGFHGEETDEVQCSMRENNEHLGPCGDCAESFNVFADLFKYYDSVKDRLAELNVIQNDKVLQDDMESWHEDITQCLRNFLDYRRHNAQAEDESIFDKEYYQDLAEDEAIVVMDFKMKILASMYREKQKDWFSKRGFSCLGALIIFGSSKESEDNEILYHLFLSDDTTQDGIYVNTAKE